MVAIVTGAGLGLGRSSAEVLGQGGQLGLGQLPGIAGNAYVNAATGNLIIQRQDELLIGRGPDIGVTQTYNSQGGLDFDNNDNWQVSLYRQLSGLTGGTGVNTAGSTITRTGADGTPLIYTYDSTAGSATLGKYVNKDGSGSFDTLTYTSASNTWVWQDGNTRIKESYAVDPNDSSKWRIASVTDLDNNSLTYTYSTTSGLTGLIDKVTSANGEVTQLIYNSSKQLTQINVINSSSVTTTRIRYTYESTALAARLTSVSTDLTPADGSIADGKTYTTTYTYDGASKRIASITNSDGSKVSFTYEASSNFRLLTISDYVTNSSTINNTTTLNYTSATTTTVTNTNNAGTSLVTTLTYDTNKQLTNIQGPSGSGQNVSYTYSANGDVTQVTDSRGNWTKYTYDAQGNQLTQQDNLGNTIVRTYDSTAAGFNQLLTETVHTGVDTTPGDAAVVGTGTVQTTRYTYDSKNHVRFTISAEGRVTEYRYSANGQLTSTHQYTDNLFTTAGNQTEAQMNTWLTAAIKAKSQRTDYLYDARGQLSEQVVYTKVNATAGSEGNGMADGTQMRTQYVYDQSGNLLQKIDARGVATTGTANDYMTSYSYDGLNRLTLTKQYDESGLEANAVSSQVTYTDASRQVSLTLANGLVTTSTYDLAGRLISVQKSDSVNTTVGSLGTTSYVYDKLGNLRSVTNESGKVTYYLYDSANRKVGEIDENKNLTEWVYNNNGQVIRTIQYNNPVTATLDATTALTNTLSTTGIRAVDAANDRVARKLYDAAGRLTKEIDALGYVTEYQYDGASRLLKTIQYANALSTTQLNAINAASGEVLPTDSNTVPVADSANDRVSRNLYDNDGKLVGALDAEGYLTEYVYDKAGRQTQKIRYATVTGSANWANGTLVTLRTNATAVSADTPKHQTTNYIYDAAGQLTGVVDAEGYLTEYQYDLVGNKAQEIRYATSITYVAGNTVIQSRPASNNEDRPITYYYDANNRLYAIFSQLDGLVTRYYFDNVGNVIATAKAYNGFLDDSARLSQRQYDSRGNLIAELGGEGVAALLKLNNPTQSQLDDIWNTYGTRYAYDNGNRLLSKVEPNGANGTGNKTLYYYDAEGKLTYSVNALGEVSQTVYNSFDQVAETRRYNSRIASTTLSGLVGGDDSAIASAITGISAGGYSNVQAAYDKAGQLISNTDELGNVNSRSYNAFGELNSRTDKIDSNTSVITSYQYDRKGLLKTTTEDASGLNRITQAVYDAFGRVTQATDGRNNVTQYQYDKLGRTVTSTTALSQNVTVTYDAFDRKVSQVDARGNATSWVYNTTSRTMTMTTAEGISVVTERNAFGEVVKVTDGRGSITSYQYNTDGQLTQTVDDSGSGKLNLTTSTSYDKAGRTYQTTDARGTVTQYSYDAANRTLSKTVDPTSVNPSGLNLTSNYRYDAQGRQIWSQDANGVWTRMDYDAKGQLSQVVTDPANIPVTDANGIVTGTAANAGGLNLATSYSYDARGKKLTVIEGDGSANPRTTQYVYDKLGRLASSIIDPGTGKLNLTTSYTYDKNDNVVLKTDAKGNKTVYSYDAEDRLSYTVDALGYVTKNEYDANGNVVKTRAYITALSSTTLTALQAAPATAITVTEVGDDRVTRYAYDKDNRLTYVTDAEWYVTRHEYDANSNVVKRTRYATKASAVKDDGTAPTVTANVTNDRVEQTVYDAAGRAIYSVDALNYVTANSYDANGNVVSSTRYATAMVGTLTTNIPPQILTAAGSGNYVVTSSNDRTEQTVYDTANRATYQVDALSYLTEIKYDGNGNITKRTRFYSKMQGTLATNVAPQVLTAAGTGNYVVSSSSNDRVTTNTWDDANRLLTTQSGADASITYLYDAVGNRIQATQNWVNTRYNYDAAGRMVDEMRGYGTSLVNGTHYYYDALGNQTGIAEGYGTSVSRYTSQSFDALGRKTQVTDALGKTTKTEYNAFGEIVKVTDANNKAGYFYVDKRGLVTLQVNPEGAATATAYDAFGNVTSIIGYATKVTGTLTTAAKPTVTTSAADQRQAVTYNRQGDQTWVQTYWGTGANDYYTDTYTYNAFGEVISAKARNGAYTSYGYDKLGRKIQETLPVTSLDAGGVAKSVVNAFNYDALGNLTSKTEASGLPEARTTSYQYDKSNRLTREQKQTFTAFNPVTGADVSVTPAVNKAYDVFGRLTVETDANGNKTWYYYDVLNRQIGKVDGSGVYTTTSYDAVGNKSSETVYANRVQLSGTAVQGSSSAPSIVTAIPASTSNVVYVLADADNDRATAYSYDGVGRVTGTTLQNITTGIYNTSSGQYEVNTGSITTQNVYDAMGNLTKQVDGNGNITRNWVNNAGQLVAKLDAEGYLTTWARDVYGNISKETRYATKPANAATNALTASDSTTLAQITTTAATLGSSDDRITEITFDRLNRTVTETVKAVAQGTANATTGALTQNTADAITSYTYNGLNNITQKTDATGAITNYSYDNIGRKTAELKPTITDYTGASVRPETGWEYDGLSNVKRELRRGTDNTADATKRSGQVESDDQITTYEYGINGLLTAETDATGARTEYRYDGNGNLTKETLKDRRTADQPTAGTGTDDVKAYSYDALNRQTKTTDVGTTTVQEVQYNAFGQITGKRNYAGTPPTTWDEVTQYDRAGRVWKSNAGDGVTKITVTDKNGNATGSISSSVDMGAMTFNDIRALSTGQTMYSFSTYDKKNQLIQTIQPSMDGTHQNVSVVQINDTNQSLVVTSGSAGTVNGSSAAQSTNPVTAGSVSIIGEGSLSGTSSLGLNTTPWYSIWFSGFVINSFPDTSALGSGALRIVITSPAGGLGTPTSTTYYTSGTPVEVPIYASYNNGTQPTSSSPKGKISVYKQTQALGDILLVDNIDMPQNLNSGTINISIPLLIQKTIILSGQPSTTDKLLLSYRLVGSLGAYTTVSVPQMVNTANAEIAGMYAFDYSSLTTGSYEFEYVALDSLGQILNQQSGTFNTSNANAPTISAQTPLAIGGIGRAFFSNTSVSGTGSGLQLMNQGADAASVTMRYKLKTSSSWTDSTTSFVPNNGFGTGSFVLDPAGLSGMTNGNDYDVEFEIKNSSGVVLRTVSGTIKKDSTGFSVVGNLQAPSKLTFTQPTTATKLSIRYKTLGSPGAYGNPIILDTVGNGKFEWDPASLIPNLANTYDYDFDIEARNADGILVNHNQVDLRLGATTTQLASQNIALPQVLRVKPSQTGISYVRLSYRVKGSTANYTALNANVTASTNADASTEYRFELPATLTAGDYEYSYTAYAADTLDANGDTVRNALGSATGYFTAGSTGSASRLDWVIQTSTNVTDNAIKRSQTYNAFGEVISETDGRDNVTTYTYNTMGAMTKKVAPTVSITKDNGEVVTNATPTTEYTYDAIGRVIAVKDANNNLNTQVWLAGSSAEGSITLEKHADGGIKAAGFDIFGNKRTEYDELATSRTTSAADAIHRTDYSYDKENRLVKVERQKRNDTITTRSTDQYTYDAAGNRISHINAANDTEKTFYDSLGRVTKTTSFMNFDTTYTYTYVNDVVGVGSATVSGWQKVTTDATLRTLIDKTDMFNHVTWHQDLGGHQFTYAYNQAGWLMSQTSIGSGVQFSGQNIAYEYYNNGNIKAIHDKAVGMYTYYEYDKDGNRTFEGYISLKDAENFAAGAKDYYQYATIKYDAMNRMTEVKDPKATINYEYDAVGNRRMVTSTYNDGVDGSKQTQTYWYKYDSMNRFLITMGTLNGARGGTSTITQGTTGVNITYNWAGQRTQAINGGDSTTEGYSYTNDGYLTNVTINGVTRSSRTNDVLGRVTTYQEFGGSNPNNKTTTYDKDNRVTLETGTYGKTDYFYYTDDANYSGTGAGALARTKNDSDGDGSDGTGTIVNTYYAYQYWDDAKQFAITNQGYNATLGKNNQAWGAGYSELTYDVNGHLSGAVDRSGNRSFRYVNDAQGLILLRDEIAGGTVNRVQRYYYVDGKRVGDVGNDGDVRTDYVQAMANRSTSKTDYKNWKPVSSADFDQNYEPISPNYPGFTATNYTVKNGETLQSIARTVWGDADMWYLIADANGLTSGSTLTTGQVLTIPNKVTNIHNNSGTYRVYNPGEAIGDVNPTLPTAPPPPKKKKKGCGGFAMIIVAVVAVVATIYTAGALTTAAGATFGQTMAAGATALAGGTTAAGMTLGFTGGLIAGAVGSIAGQLAGNALGVQKGFSWAGVATSALTAGLGANGILPTVGVDATWGQIAANAAIRNTVGQGLNIAAGQQKGFSWASVAASAIAAPITNSLTKGLDPVGSSIGTDLARATTGALVSATTRLVVEGGKVSWAAVAADTLTSFIQSRAASNVVKVPVTRQEQLIKRFKLDPEKNFTDNRFINDMLYMERGGQVSEERRRDMAEFGMRQLGASDDDIRENFELLNKSEFNLFKDTPVPQVVTTNYALSGSSYAPDMGGTRELPEVKVFAGKLLSALFSDRVDNIAIGAGKLVQEIGSKISDTPALKYSLEALDIIGAPVAYAARQAIAGTYIGDSIDEAKQYMFSKASGLFTNAGYDTLEANSGGIGVFAILSVGATGAKGLLDDVASIQAKLSRVNLSAETKRLMGDAPTDMINPHRHHILEVNGRSGTHRETVREGQSILRYYDIDPTHGVENLVWAPNKGHTMDAAQRLVDELRFNRDAGVGRSEIVDILRRHGKEASER